MRYANNQSTNGSWNGFAIVDRRWAHYPIANRRGVVTPSPMMVVTFADGEVIRTEFATLKGKQLNVGRGISNAIAFYRARIARRCHSSPCDDGRGFCIDVPAITACTIYQKGSAALPLFPRTVSDASAELRRGTFNLERVKAEARDRKLPLLASAGALDQKQLIERRYQRAAARHLLANPDLIAKFLAIGSIEDVRRIAVAKDLLLNDPRTPIGKARNQYMRRPKGTWRQNKRAA